MTPEFHPALESALRRAIPGLARIENMVRLSGGASQETWSFDVIVNGECEPLILRRKQPGTALASATGVSLETEARVIEAARSGGVAAPSVRLMLTPGEGLGAGYVMDRVDGETIPRRIIRDDRFAELRGDLARQCGAELARIHAVETAPLAHVLSDCDGPAQLARYRDLYDAHDDPHGVFELAFRWLEPRLAPARIKTLVHGDFRLGNLLVSPNRIEVVLDWELTHIGDPLEDIGWICTPSWRFGRHEKVVGGFADLAELLDGYQGVSGASIDPEEVRSWIVLGSLKWGIMCMSMYQAFRVDGSVERAAIGRRVSETEIDLVNMIFHGVP
jgi:aminoglycoside phosphotransferase (APT) family kinase protein